MKKALVSQKPIIVDILSKSFDENRSVNFVVKQDCDRKKRIEGLMNYSFNVCNAFGESWRELMKLSHQQVSSINQTTKSNGN